MLVKANLRLVALVLSQDTDDAGGGTGGAGGKDDFERCRLLGSILHLLSSAATPIASAADVHPLTRNP